MKGGKRHTFFWREFFPLLSESVPTNREQKDNRLTVHFLLDPSVSTPECRARPAMTIDCWYVCAFNWNVTEYYRSFSISLITLSPYRYIEKQNTHKKKEDTSYYKPCWVSYFYFILRSISAWVFGRRRQSSGRHHLRHDVLLFTAKFF
jgi:hypothetical protein